MAGCPCRLTRVAQRRKMPKPYERLPLRQIQPPSTASRVRQVGGSRDVLRRRNHARARARSLTADFHAGYQALRSAMPMNIRSRHPGEGMTAEVRGDIDRLTSHWCRTRAQFGQDGPFLFGAYSAVDAYFAPVASRFVTYAVSLEADARAYQQALLSTAGMQAWTEAALRETEFVPADEPYAHDP